jgi:putative two-component system response regulator
MSDYSRERDMKILGVFDRLVPSTRQLICNLHSPTYLHCKYLSILARHFGDFLQLSERDLELLIFGAYFHDIGKYFISTNILDKPSELSPEEWKFIKLHPTIDNTTLQLPKDLEAIVSIIQCHHERWDGSGYPNGLAKEETPYLARIVQILDIYDALTHARSYKKTFSSDKAIAIILENTTKGWLQPILVEQFVEFVETRIEKYPHPVSLIHYSSLHPREEKGTMMNNENIAFIEL